MPRAFIPFGDMTPDLGAFNNAGLSVAGNVVPISGGFSTAPILLTGKSPSLGNGPIWSMHHHQKNDTSSVIYTNNDYRIEVSTLSSGGGTVADRSRTTGSIVTATLGAGGAGYAPGDTGTINAGGVATTATYTVGTVGGGGAVLTFSITSGGIGYSIAAGIPTVVVTGAGNGAFTINTTLIGPYSNVLSALPSGSCFTSFGQNVVFTNAVDAVQSKDAETAAVFAKNNIITIPTGSSVATGDPRALFVSWIKNHLVLANIDLTAGNDTGGIAYGGAYGSLTAAKHPEVVWWSATDNITRFTDPATHPMIIGSDFQPLYDSFGPITGVSPGGEWINIFKSNAIYRMTGPPFSFDLVTSEVGCIFPHSIIQLGNDVFFWSVRGPCVLRGGVSLEFLSRGKIEPYFKYLSYQTDFVGTLSSLFDNVMKNVSGNTTAGYPNLRLVEGAASQFDGSIMWHVGTDTNETEFESDGLLGKPKLFVHYNINEDRWSVSHPSSSIAGVLSSNLYLCGMSSMTSIIIGVNDRWAPSMGVIVCSRYQGESGFTIKPTGNLITYSQVPTSSGSYGIGPHGCLFITENLKLDQSGQSKILKIRPNIQSKESSIGSIFKYKTLVTASNNPTGATTPTVGSMPTDLSIDDHGWVSIPSDIYSDFKRIAVLIYSPTASTSDHVSNIVKFHGIEIEYSAAGVRGKPN